MRRRFDFILGLCGVLGIVGCDREEAPEQAEAKKADEAGKPDDAQAKEAEAPEGETPEPAEVLVLGDAKITPSDRPEEGLTISAAGEIAMGGRPVGSISTTGQIKSPDGQPGFSVDAAGVVSFQGKPTGATLTDDGLEMKRGGETVTMKIGSDGAITVMPAPAEGTPSITSEGCTGAMAKTCSLVMFGMLMPMQQAGATLTPEGAAPAPPP